MHSATAAGGSWRVDEGGTTKAVTERGNPFFIRTAYPPLTDGKTWTYQYDNAGNIVYKRTYNYTTGEPGTPVSVSYRQFTDASWGDLMTVYNGRTIKLTAP